MYWSRRVDEVGVGNPVERLEQKKGIEGREVPGDRAPIAGNESDPAQKGRFAPLGLVTKHLGHTRVGVQQPRQHLEDRRFSGAVGTKEPDDLAGREIERGPLDRHHFFVPTVDQTLDRGLEPSLPYRHLEGAAQVRNMNRMGQ